MKKFLIGLGSSLRTLVLVATLIVGVGYVYAASWSGPTAAAPGNNTEAPVNVGSSFQVKTGNLAIGSNFMNTNTVGLQVDGSSVFHGKMAIVDGTEKDGYVLTTNSTGVASWKPIPEVDPVLPICAANQTLKMNTMGTAWICTDVLKGTLCGMEDVDGTKAVIQCNGYNPGTSCPTGYSRQKGAQISDNSVYSCVKN